VKPLTALAAVATGGLAWGHFEAGWLRTRRRRCPVAGLPPELDGVRIAHLSDFHLGFPSRGATAVERAIDWTAALRPDLVCLTGDLLSHPRGWDRLRGLLARLPASYAVLGNHDYGVARGPFVRAAGSMTLGPHTTLLADSTVTVELRGLPVQLVGVDPRSFMGKRARPEQLADPDAALRILLCHFPEVVDRLPPAVFDLVLAGHLHDGQIAIPYGRGKLRLAHPVFPYPGGFYRLRAGTMHVSPGLGTTFVPFRFFARPEATELVLERA
jgi:uncharacterized protein